MRVEGTGVEEFERHCSDSFNSLDKFSVTAIAKTNAAKVQEILWKWICIK